MVFKKSKIFHIFLGYFSDSNSVATGTALYFNNFKLKYSGFYHVDTDNKDTAYKYVNVMEPVQFINNNDHFSLKEP